MSGRWWPASACRGRWSGRPRQGAFRAIFYRRRKAGRLGLGKAGNPGGIRPVRPRAHARALSPFFPPPSVSSLLPYCPEGRPPKAPVIRGYNSPPSFSAYPQFRSGVCCNDARARKNSILTSGSHVSGTDSQAQFQEDRRAAAPGPAPVCYAIYNSSVPLDLKSTHQPQQRAPISLHAPRTHPSVAPSGHPGPLWPLSPTLSHERAGTRVMRCGEIRGPSRGL